MAEERAQDRRGGRSSQSTEARRLSASSGTGGATGAGSDLGEAVGLAARSLQERHGDVEATLQVITESAVGVVPGVEEASVSYVTGRRRVEARAATGDLPRQLDEIQNRLQEGPCLDAVWTESTVRIDDLRSEERWPRFAAAAAALGVLSSVSFQLFVEGDNLGAINLYSRQPRAFGEESEDVGLVFAAHAAVALAGARHETDLRTGMGSRDLIGQAKGILMERYAISADRAFAVLARVSQQTNRRLVDIATELTATRAVPEVPASARARADGPPTAR